MTNTMVDDLGTGMDGISLGHGNPLNDTRNRGKWQFHATLTHRAPSLALGLFFACLASHIFALFL